MLAATGALFTLGVALFLWDFFFPPRQPQIDGTAERAAVTPA